MTTDQAFTKMIHTTGMHKKIGRTAKYMTWLRAKNAEGNGISMEAKMNMLLKSGYKIKQDIEWGEPR